MSSYILLGKNINFENIEHKSQEGLVKILGDGRRYIDCDILKFEANSNVKIYAHGERISLKKLHSFFSPKDFEYITKIGTNYLHYFSLCVPKDYKIPSFVNLVEMSNGKAINFVLASGYGETAINDIFFLPKGSTLITLNSPEDESIQGLMNEIIIRSKDFDYQDNPFMQYAFYLINNPNSNSFAVGCDSGVEIFKSSIDDLFSQAKPTFFQKDIREWQNIQLQNFINFCNEIRSKMNMRHSNNIKEFLNFAEDSSLFDQDTLDRYQELLLVSIIERGEVDIMDTPENMKIVKDFVFISGVPYFMWAIEKNNISLIEKLINYGADVNMASSEWVSVLQLSMMQESMEVAKLLIEAGADIDSVYKGMTILCFCVYKGKMDASRLLIESGVDINLKSFNKTALEIAKMENNFEAVCELLKAGAMLSEIKSKGYILDLIGETKLLVISIFSKIISNKYYTDLINISEEEASFTKDPIEYILVHNDQVVSALNAMDNLMLHENLVEMHPQILEIKDCLSQLPDTVNGDLNILCGRDQFTQDHNEL